MIPFRFKTLVLLGAACVGVLCVYGTYIYFTNLRDTAVAEALQKVEALDNEILLRKQARVMQQQSEASAKIQRTQAISSATRVAISKAQTVDEGVAIKSSLIDEINCRIENFLDYTICEK